MASHSQRVRSGWCRHSRSPLHSSVVRRPRKTLDTWTAAALHGRDGQHDQSVLARAPTVPRVPGRPSEPSEDVPEAHNNGSVVSQLRAESPLGRLGDVPRTEEVGNRRKPTACVIPPNVRSVLRWRRSRAHLEDEGDRGEGVDPRPGSNPGDSRVDSTCANWSRFFRKRVADCKHGFESPWGHTTLQYPARRLAGLRHGRPLRLLQARARGRLRHHRRGEAEAKACPSLRESRITRRSAGSKLWQQSGAQIAPIRGLIPYSCRSLHINSDSKEVRAVPR